MITLDDIKKDPIVDTCIRKGNEYLGVMGFTEHGYRHINLISRISRNILERLNYPQREVELAAIAGYMHDIGNVISRYDHGQSGATLAFHVLSKMGMSPEEIAMVISAIGNHEEEYGHPVNSVAAALILADKSDVHRSRVRNQDFATFDIHDRVNYAVEHSFLRVTGETRKITMELTIDIQICPVMEYFEIFLSRMVLCRRAADFLNSRFALEINGAKLL
ncbi:HD domain-containing protein [Phosphitispora fastidiosa]|uniref:HD domain-containing protein n=1 Tax=Phosphitispora fastidiosa TaxID=2837202 RepID=UPI001E590764|nr:HD domain-containing protein [Phosphitispora fastidiosa]MBU7007871.1 metal-dependent HD superfamily phosphatase/phosphodiesterase [Phosphitispora fastidiosa]